MSLPDKVFGQKNLQSFYQGCNMDMHFYPGPFTVMNLDKYGFSDQFLMD
jgi:hypothetical protein